MKSKALATRGRKPDINILIEEIRGTQLDMFENYVKIGVKLNIIKEEKLFLGDGYGDFSSFLKDEKRHGFQFTPAEAWQCIRISEVVGAIKEMRDKQPDDIKELVPLPSSQSQIKPLMKLPDSRAGDTWISGAIHAHKVQSSLTNRFMTDFINGAEKIVEQAPPISGTDGQTAVETNVDFSTAPEGAPTSPFSAEALECLAKIEALCPHTFPEGSRTSIEQELIKGVDNYTLELWNKHPVHQFKAIGRLVFNRGMTFDKAQRFVLRQITLSSTIMDLVYAAVAYGGFRLKVDEDRFIISVTETADQPVSAVA